jgi:hypothetical protein
MLIFYMPPHRDADEAESAATCARALQDYLEDLAEFPADALRAGWKEIRRSHKRLGWPLISEIRAACVGHQRISVRAQDPSENVFQKLQRRATEIDSMARKYVDGFMAGELGREARSEGWQSRLRDYVQREAHLQAQRIARTGRGAIDVTIPGELVSEWRSVS